MKKVKYIGDEDKNIFTEIYELEVFELGEYDFYHVLISGKGFATSCSYDSLKEFLEEWEEVND